jgi:hypothetical protein
MDNIIARIEHIRSKSLNYPTVLILSPHTNVKIPVCDKKTCTMLALKARGINVRFISFSIAGEPCWIDLTNTISTKNADYPQHQNSGQDVEQDVQPFTTNGLPDDMSEVVMVHIPLDKDYHMLPGLISVCKKRGAQRISVSFPDHIFSSEISDLDSDIAFFINTSESKARENIQEIFPPAGSMRFEIRADGTIDIHQGEYFTSVPAREPGIKLGLNERGLFEGYVLEHLIHAAHPIMAARYAVRASLTNENVDDKIKRSPATLEIGIDNKVSINSQQVEKVAKVVKGMAEAQPFDYAGERHPGVGDPHAVDYFFAVTLQQFGFWEDDGEVYQRPMIATLDGDQLKGSAYMAQAYFRKITTDPEFYTPAVQANLKQDDLLAVMRSDDGGDPLPALTLHLDVANRYGRDMLALGLTPEMILEKANAEPKPLTTFIQMLDRIGGYKEDPLRKKSNLLAMILSQRPECFLRKKEGENLLPVVDYHCMRACLRLGLIDIIDDSLRDKLVDRRFVSNEEEWSIRFAAYQIQAMVEELSGKTIGVVDWFFFNYMRARCFEMTAPECSRCAANQVCLHREQFFQPVIRTTHY